MNTNIEYTRGIKTEERLISFLKENGFNVTPSTRHENINYDIDCWEDDAVAVSIKAQHTALRTGNLAFELVLTNQDGSTEDGWFRTGHASVYWIVVGNQLYKARKADIASYVLKHKWSRKAHLSAQVAASQKRINHKHIDSVVGLLPMSSLLEHKVLEWLCTVPDGVAYPT
jgi:hypothetical protein